MRILLFLLFTTAVTFGWGQILTFDFAGIAGSEATINSNTNNPGITTSTISRGAGVTAAANADRFNATNWAITSIANAIAGNDYLEFTITPAATCDFSISSISIQLQRSATGPSAIVLRSSIDAFAANLDAQYSIVDNTSTQTFTFTFSQSNISTATTYRFYMFAEAAGGTGGIGDGAGNDLIVNGTTSCSSNTITTTTVATSPFVVTCNTAATGSVDFTSTGTFNPANVYTAQLSDELGDFTIPTNIGTLASTALSGTIPLSIPAGTVAGSLYRIRVISNDPLTIGTDNGIDLTITNNCIITTGTVSSSSFSVSCAAGTNGTIDFTSSSTMLGGNVYSAQLSDAAGSFIASTTIGTLSSTADNGTISFTIPATTTTGSNYLIRVIASNPSTTGNSSVPLTITLTDGPCAQVPPHLTSVIINSCDPTCDEGYNEIVFGTSGDYSFDVNTTNFDFLYGSTNPGTNYTDVLVNNTTGINQLNTAAGCPGLFIDAVGTTIPPNSSWVLVYRDICEEALTWSGLCGSGPIYVIFQNDANWSTTGNFANNPSAASPIRYFRTAITTTSGSTFTINYTTDGNQYPDNDGVYATFDANGGAATSYGDNNCILDPVLLPSDLVNFKGQIINSQSLLTWETSSEQNNDYFTISHSTTGYNFEAIGQVQGAGNATTLNNYNLTHDRPSSGINYYKLTSTDFDGTTYVKGIVSLLFNSHGCYFDAQTSEIKFNERSDYRIFSMDGKLLGEVMNESSLLFNQQGIVLIQDLRTGLTERLFVP